MTDDGSRREFLQILGEHDVPAFLRRAQGVSEGWKSVVGECRTARRRLLEIPRMRLGVLAETAAHRWSDLESLLMDPSMAHRLRDYHSEWKPVLRAEVQIIDDPRMWSRHIDDLIKSFERFNVRWKEYVEAYDFNLINALRDGYNKYYVIEKSCAFDSDRVGMEGFVELEMATPKDIIQELPLLHVPRRQ